MTQTNPDDLPATRADQLSEQIADAILSGEFAPGFRLDEQALAGRFGVSRTPVREALRHLAATGMIEIRPRRSAVVATPTGHEIERLFVAMGEMEATCARLSAISMTPVERRRLQARHTEMAAIVANADPAAFAAANHAFHGLIYLGAHNEVLADFTTALRRRLAPYRRAQFWSEGRLPRSQAEHAVVVDAILAGDAAAAHAAMLHHVSLVEDAWASLAFGA